MTHELLAEAVDLYSNGMEINGIIELPEYKSLGIGYMGMYKAIFRIRYKRFSDMPIPKARPTCHKGREKLNYDLSDKDVITIRLMKDRGYSYPEIANKLGYPKHVIATVGKGKSKQNIKNENYPDLVAEITAELDKR